MQILQRITITASDNMSLFFKVRMHDLIAACVLKNSAEEYLLECMFAVYINVYINSF